MVKQPKKLLFKVIGQKAITHFYSKKTKILLLGKNDKK